MTSLNKQHRADPIDQLLAHLQDDSVLQEIGDRLDAATDCYSRQTHDVIDCITFKKELADFIQHVYRHGLIPPRQISHRVALAEAIHILDSPIVDGHQGSYESAYLDATTTANDDLETTFRHLAETIKQQEIHKFRDWRYSTLIDPTDRDLHQSIVQNLMGRFDKLLRNQKKTGGPDHWSKHYLDLLMTIKESNDLVNQIITGTDKIYGI